MSITMGLPPHGELCAYKIFGTQEKSPKGVTISVFISQLNGVQRTDPTKVTAWSPGDVCPDVFDSHILTLGRNSHEESPKSLQVVAMGAAMLVF